MSYATERLLVRPFTPADAGAIFRLSQEEGLRRFLPDQVYADEAEASRVLSFLIAQGQQGPRPEIDVQAVVLAETAELIGHVGLSPAEGGVEIGYAIAAAAQGRGYATELVREASRRALAAGLPRLLAVVDCANLASIRVLEKAGFAFLEERERTLHGVPTRARVYAALPPR